MRLHRLISCVTILLAVGGCSNGTPSDPVANYTKFIQGEFEQVKTAHPNFSLGSQYKIDVQKTDSLVSPLVGTCNVNALWPIEMEKLQFTILFRVDVVMTHGYQDGKWVFTTGKGKIIGSEVLKIKDTSRYRSAVKAAQSVHGFDFNFSSLDDLGKRMTELSS